MTQRIGLRFVLLYVILGFWFQSAEASHLQGVDMTYECLNNCTVRVYLRAYRDCGGAVGISNTVSWVGDSPLCFTPVAINNWSAQVTTPVTPVCPGTATLCDVPQPVNPVVNGVQEYFWFRDYDICTGNCNSYTLSWGVCCRNASITSLQNPGSTGMGTYSTTINANLQPCNSSPQFNNPPVPYICAGLPFTFNQGASDPDGDSLSYAFGPCFDDNGNQVTYNAGFSGTSPLGPSWTVVINPATGDVTITPQPGNIVVGVLCVYVTEWRNGVQIGTVVRDVQVQVINCPSNSPPLVNATTNVTGGFGGGGSNTGIEFFTCVGNNFCFDLPAVDPNTGDSVTMWWNQNIPGATFVQTGNPSVTDTISGINPSATFCWVPPAPGVYQFLVQMEDNACPIIGFTQFSVVINVSNIQTSAFNLAPRCDTVDLCALPTNGIPPYTFSWTGQGGLSSTDSCVTHVFPGPGTYGYSVTVTDSAGCSFTYTDSVSIVNSTVADAGPDIAYCDGGSGQLGGPPTANEVYSWSPATGLNNPNISNPTVSLSHPGPGPLPFVQTYILSIMDTITGCADEDTVVVTVSLQPELTLDSVDVSCFGGSDGQVNLAILGLPPYTFSWTGPGTFTAATQNLTGLATGMYVVVVTDAAGCVSTDSIFVNQPLAPLTSSMVGTNVTCNGANDGAGDLTVNGGTPPYTYSWSGGGATQDTTGLAAGTWFVTITDDNGCVRVDSVVVTQPTALNLTFTSTNVSCNGNNDGLINATASGGYGNYGYTWQPGGMTTPSLTGLAPGTYVVTLSDTGGNGVICTYVDSVTITQPQPLATQTTATPVGCNGGNNGTGVVVVQGGNGNYSFLWSNGSTSTTATNLTAGTWYVTVTDTAYTTAGGGQFVLCTALDSVTITEPTQLTAVTASTDALCFGANDGTATVTPSGGTPPYNYAWSTIPTQITATAVNLGAGTYNVVVTDANGCQISASATVGEPAPLGLSLGSFTATCGNANGSAFATANGGTPPYTYIWNTAPPQVQDTARNLFSGWYTVVATDANGCIISDSVQVLDTPIPQLNVDQVIPVSCFGGSDGSATVSGFGSFAPYTFLWSNGQTGPTATGLSATSYSVTVTDANGCSGVSSVTVTTPPALADSIIARDIGCNAVSPDGSVGVVASGGTPPYTYNWSNGGTNPLIANLGLGTYTVTITDANGCTLVDSGTVGLQPSPTVVAGPDMAFCEGDGGVIINAFASGGTPGYYYQWWCDTLSTYCGLDSIFDDDPNANPTVTTTYYVQVTDTNGCLSNIDSLVVTVYPKPIVDAGADLWLCGDSAPCQILNPVVTGGSGLFTYQWLPSTGLSNDTILNPCARPDSTTIYTLVATDVTTGCMSDVNTLDTLSTVTVHVNPIPVAEAGPNVDICFGDTTMLQGYGFGAGPSYLYQWSPAQSLNDSTLPNPNAWPSVSTYYTLVVLSNNCPSYADTVFVDVHNIPTVNAGPDRDICLGDSVLLDAQGGGDSTATYSYNWTPNMGLSNNTLEDVMASPDTTTWYYVTTTTNWGCESAPDSALVTVKPTPLAEAGPIQTICEGDTAQLQGGIFYTTTPPVPNPSQIYYSWNPAANMSDSTVANPFVWPTATTWYQLDVRYNTCLTEDSVLVTVIPKPVADAAADTSTICSGDSILISASGGLGGASFNWIPSTGLSNPDSSVTYASPDQSVNYVLVVEEGGCSDTLEFPVDVIPTPDPAYVSSLENGCVPHAVNFLQTAADGVFYIWDFGDGSPVSNEPNPIHTYTTPGDYTVNLTVVNTGGCKASINDLTITVNDTAFAEFSSNPIYPVEMALPNTNVTFIDESINASDWIWDFGDGLTSSLQNPDHTYTEPGQYMVKLTVTNPAGCVGSVIHGPYIVQTPDLSIPNVFTPNGDGINDRFLVQYTGSQPFLLAIFDRWGNQLYEGRDKYEGWTGLTADGANAPEGVYFYVVKIGDREFTGNATLMR